MTVSGPVIESGTVVVADGLVRAVGTDVPIPPEAWVIDGHGLTVYPGLMDGLSNLGLQAGDGGSGGSPRAGGGGSPLDRPTAATEPAEGPEDRPATTPWKSAADELTDADDRLERWREGGFTTALSVPSEGIVTGQGAVINLGGEPEEMVVKAPAALRINLRPVGSLLRGYPGSLFGVISYVEQLFLDADNYTRATATYEAQPAGRPRPRYDRTLHPVQRSVAEGWAVLIPGDEPREIRRAVELGEQLGVRTVVYGGHGGYAVADELAAKGVSVLVNLKWPERTTDADPEAEESLRTLEMRANAASTPAALHEAGVPFAFYSGGLATPRQTLRNARKAIDAGLTEEVAVRALTLGAAEIYGVADRLGSVEPGKIADLLVADGGLFDEGTKVKMVFVDGRKYEVQEASRPTEPPAVELGGKWSLTVQTPRGVQESTLDLAQAEDGSLSGTLVGSRGEAEVTDGWVSGKKFSFTVTFSRGGRSFESTYTGALEGERMKGTVSFGRFSAEFTGERPEEGEGGGR